MIIGLSGKYCSGKNTVAAVFEELGFLCIDVDKQGHRVLELVKHEVVREFTSEILLENGSIDRKKLGEIVFRNKNALSRLEEIVHPQIIEEVKLIINQNPERDIVINAALLHRMNIEKLCTFILWVKAPLLDRINRGRARDGMKLSSVLHRIWVQRKLNPQLFFSKADIHIIRNSASVGELNISVQSLLNDIPSD